MSYCCLLASSSTELQKSRPGAESSHAGNKRILSLLPKQSCCSGNDQPSPQGHELHLPHTSRGLGAWV